MMVPVRLLTIAVLSVALRLPVPLPAGEPFISGHQGPADIPCDSVPALNREIVALVKAQIGKQVDRGECWDLAAMALNATGARWDGMYRFGRKVNPQKECVHPGDMIQFEGVKVRYTQGRATYTETMQHHTAVIFEIKGKGVFVLAHQNTGTSGRKVGLSDLDLKTIVRGRYTIFRPEK